MAGDAGVRSIKDAQELKKKFDEVMAPVQASVDKVKTLKKKKDIEIAFGFTLQGEWPGGGKAAPPTPSFGLKITF